MRSIVAVRVAHVLDKNGVSGLEALQGGMHLPCMRGVYMYVSMSSECIQHWQNLIQSA